MGGMRRSWAGLHENFSQLQALGGRILGHLGLGWGRHYGLDSGSGLSLGWG